MRVDPVLCDLLKENGSEDRSLRSTRRQVKSQVVLQSSPENSGDEKEPVDNLEKENELDKDNGTLRTRNLTLLRLRRVKDQPVDVAGPRYPRRYNRTANYVVDDEGDDEGDNEEDFDQPANNNNEEPEVRRTSRVRTEVQRYSPCQNNEYRSSPRKRFRRRQALRDSGHRRRLGGDSDEDLVQDRSQWGLIADAVIHQDAPQGGLGTLPNNMNHGPINLGPMNPMKSKNAEITPVQVDETLRWSDIGGLEHYVNSLKEMVFLPLVYPEVFQKFHINPPKGVLLHGPPGTGKTLCARALASAAARSGKKVSFFMRKGADVLSKWVGESERQLRLLFAEAQKCQPSIIFFDEIDGLAPVRSSKQDQIHNSIVSTLLALMDGLDSRGQVVIIGATNRIDAVDGALRRPGRFDRELSFPLPNVKARSVILDIHTKKWAKPLETDLKEELATTCVGYCGADLKALCTEATLQALRRQYPQIYMKEEKLLIDTERVQVQKQDFFEAQKSITPASHRSATVHARPLPHHIDKCFTQEMVRLREIVSVIFSAAQTALKNKISKKIDYAGVLRQMTCKPRLLIVGEEGMGQNYLGPALLHDLEALPCFSIGHPDLLAFPGAHMPEEALVNIFCEARKASPAIVFLPHAEIWWSTSSLLLRSTLITLVKDLSSSIPLFFLATASVPTEEMPEDFLDLFCKNAFVMPKLVMPNRVAMFENIFERIVSGYEKAKSVAPTDVEELPLAPVEESKELTAKELELKAEEDEDTLRNLRMLLRNQLLKLMSEHRWRIFSEALDEEERRECEEANCKPMDLLTILSEIDKKTICTVKDFQKAFEDVAATTNVLYNSQVTEEARVISRAHALLDNTQTWLKTLPEKIVSKCEEISCEREKQKKLETPERRRRTSARMSGEAMEEDVQHIDPEAVVRRMRQEKRQADAEEALRAKEAEKAKEAEREEKGDKVMENVVTPMEPKEVQVTIPDKTLADSRFHEMCERTKGMNLDMLDSLHASLEYLIGTLKHEPNRMTVLDIISSFLSSKLEEFSSSLIS